MSWAKRNIYFLASCIVAVVLLLLAGWYCFASWKNNSATDDQLKQAYSQLAQIAGNIPGAGNDTVTNIDAAKAQTIEAKQRITQLAQFFTPIHSVGTNHYEDRALSAAIRETNALLRASAQAHNVTLPVTTPEFAFSFSLQAGKISYDPGSGPMLLTQLAEVKAICDTLYSSRILALEAILRERSSDDGAAAQMTSQSDYLDASSLTNGNTVITPYQVTFQCYTTELGNVLANFANLRHTVVVKTLAIQPADGLMGMAMGMDPGVGGGGAVQQYLTQAGGATAVAPGAASGRGGLATAIDEKKLRVTMLLDFVKILPAQAR